MAVLPKAMLFSGQALTLRGNEIFVDLLLTKHKY